MIETRTPDREEITPEQIRAMIAGAFDRAADAYDSCVVAGFVLLFIPDPAAALRSYRRILRDRGRGALSTLGRDEERWSWAFCRVTVTRPEGPGSRS